MDDNPEVIRQQMEETRSHLAEKLEALENQVTDTVQSTTTAVSDTVEAVKETVENVTETVKDTVEKAKETVAETVTSVGEALDLRIQTEHHPWLVLGGSVALGFTVAQLLGSSKEDGNGSSGDRAWNSRLPALEATSTRQYSHPPAEAPPAQTHTASPEESKPSWFSDQIGRLKGLAIGSLMGVVRDLVKRNLPGELGQRLSQEVDSLTSKLGGEPIHGSLFGSENKGSESGNQSGGHSAT